MQVYIYFGETCRNAYCHCRGQEHMKKGLERMDDESVLIEHVREWHDRTVISTG